jgi:hypothetical protein
MDRTRSITRSQHQNANEISSWSNAVLNLTTDIAIFILPMPVILRLVVLFSMGFFICLTTALRMATLSASLHAKEPTYQSAPANLWSFIEAAVGVICACLISLRKSIGSMWPKKWRSTRGTSSGAYRAYGSGALSGHGIPSTRPQDGTRNSTYPLGAMKSGGKGAPDIYENISPSESQEQIMGVKGTHVTTSQCRSGSLSGSDDLIIQGITVTTDVKIIRE